jgi:heme/copper-type cytochrome/quinol oxidase subunit 2
MVINDADKTPAESALAETVTLEDDEVPLAGKSSSHWALINLILTLITIAISIVLLVMYFRHDDEEYEDEGFLVHVTYKKKGLARILSIIPGIIAIIAFILTEDITLPIGLIDRWTPIMLLIALIEVGFVIVAQKEKEEDASYIME